MWVVAPSHRAGPRDLRRARAVARRLGAPLVPPGPSSAPLEYRVEQGAEYVLWSGERLSPHPGLWLQKSSVGPRHPLLMALAPDGSPRRILDATAGLGQDALHVAGFGHQVLAAEAVAVLGCLLQGFLRRAAGAPVPWSSAAGRVRVVLADHRDLLPLMKSHSLDAVFFDPMFHEPRKSAPGFEAFRSWARAEPLSRGALVEATRVAQRRVVVKVPAGHRLKLADGGPEGLGFNRRVPSRAFDYWVIEKRGPARWAAPKVRRRPDQQPQPPAGP